MEKGYIQIYTGDGKGKTTAAIGLAVRCAGQGGRVLMVQFLKARPSGEVQLLSSTAGIEFIRPCETKAFSFKWTDADKTRETANAKSALDTVRERFKSGVDLVILDEALGALNTGIIASEDIDSLIAQKPETTELVLTGRDCPKTLAAKADLITEMKPVKHYADKGVMARKGIEF